MPDDPRQKKIWKQWLAEYVDTLITQAHAKIRTRNPGLSENEIADFFLMSLPPVPDDARELTEQIFRWGITVPQFIVIQKTLDPPLYPSWDECHGRSGRFFNIFIGQEGISLVESEYPELRKGAECCQKFIDALNLLWEDRGAYTAARGFWGFPPVEIETMRDRIFKLYKYLCDVDRTTTEEKATAPTHGGLARYVESLYAEGKTAQEIAILLQGKGLSRHQIGVLLREGDDIIGDYGKWLDGKGWLKNPKK